ncbi:MAG: glucuronate isomerase, partial [Alphaproteobacteria bacterium]
MTQLHPDRFFASDPTQRRIARDLYESVKDAPIISPHGHCEPAWFADDEPFPDPAELLIIPDHYVFRMLRSQGVNLDTLGVPRRDGVKLDADPRDIWQVFADHWHLFQATPTRLWMEHVLQEVLGVTDPLTSDSASAIYDHIEKVLQEPDFRP